MAISPRLQEQANNWLISLRENADCPRAQRQFSQWLNRSPIHQQAFDQALADWKNQSLRLHESDHLRQRLHQLNHQAAINASHTHNKSASKLFQHGAWLGAAAALVMVFSVVFFNAGNTATQQLMTQVGEISTHQLSDGSTVRLNTNSQVLVDYQDHRRQLTLVRGEAFFEVAHNPRRPFVVTTERGAFTALGTAFNIHLQARQVQLQVTEGRVLAQQHSDPTTPQPKSKTLTKNQQVSLDGHGFSSVNQAPKHPSWHQGQLHFNQTTMSDALAQLNRYLTEPVQLDPSLEPMSVTGIYQLTNPNQALALLAASKGLSIHRHPNGQRQLKAQTQ